MFDWGVCSTLPELGSEANVFLGVEATLSFAVYLRWRLGRLMILVVRFLASVFEWVMWRVVIFSAVIVCFR